MESLQALIGQTLGQYRIIEQIGEGGMAAVFKAYQPGLNREVALKVLFPTSLKKRILSSGLSARPRPSAIYTTPISYPFMTPARIRGTATSPCVIFPMPGP